MFITFLPFPDRALLQQVQVRGVAQHARHPDELKKEDGKWMIDIDYYLSQQVWLSISSLSSLSQILPSIMYILQLMALIFSCKFILWYHVFVLQFRVPAQNTWLIA